jgi:hypothetical protein
MQYWISLKHSKGNCTLPTLISSRVLSSCTHLPGNDMQRQAQTERIFFSSNPNDAVVVCLCHYLSLSGRCEFENVIIIQEYTVVSCCVVSCRVVSCRIMWMNLNPLWGGFSTLRPYVGNPLDQENQAALFFYSSTFNVSVRKLMN